MGDKVTAGLPVPLFTTCDNTAEVLPRKVASPPYTAVIECVATVNVLVENFATPPLSATDDNVVAPSLNVTVPVGVPGVATPVTVAVKVTDCPAVDGLRDEARAVVLVAVCAGFGSANTAVSSTGLACVGKQLPHLLWKPLTVVAGVVSAKKLSDRVRAAA